MLNEALHTLMCKAGALAEIERAAALRGQLTVLETIAPVHKKLIADIAAAQAEIALLREDLGVVRGMLAKADGEVIRAAEAIAERPLRSIEKYIRRARQIALGVLGPQGYPPVRPRHG